MAKAQTQAEQQRSAHAPRVEAASKPGARRFKKRWVIVGIVVAVLAYSAVDLYGPRTTKMRAFDPNEVARLDTAMWRSYYNRQRLRLFNQLSELLRTQYNLPFLRSNVVAYQAARAAFVFKEGQGRADYEKALPYLVNFYAAIRKVGDVPFDVDRAAKLELEWWIVHRERKQHEPGDLERALAESAGEIYQAPVERLMEYARLRAEAMNIRDSKAEAGGVSEQDWARIAELLEQSWQSLWEAVNNP